MKTTIDLPDDLVRSAKLRAVMQGVSLRELVAEYIREGLGLTRDRAAGTAEEPAVVFDEDGVPSFRCDPDRLAPKMTIEESIRLQRHAEREADGW